MRLLILALFTLLVGCFASSADFVSVAPVTELTQSASTSCQGNCDGLSTATCDKDSAKRRVAYFDASNIRRHACEQIWPGRLNTTGFTHIIFSSAVFDPKTFAVHMEHPDDGEIYRQFMHHLEGLYRGLAIGERNMPNEGSTRTAWSDMSSTKASRKAFIDSLKLFLETWKFSGIEIHWEWPGAWNRGGNPADTQNQVDLVHELRESFGKEFGISVVLPVQYEYLKNMDPLKMQDAVDWFTVLTYDLHGPWDAGVSGLGPKIKPHTDLAEINAALDLLSSAKLDPSKVHMGIANYGRGFTVADQNCKYYGCKFIGPSKAGICTKEDGFLSACEIRRTIKEKNLRPQIIQGGAGVKEISWDDQWIGYDDDETLWLKLELANKRCLGGTSLWSLDNNHCDSQVSAPQSPSPVGPVLSSLAQPLPPSFTSSAQPPVIPLPGSSSLQNLPSETPSESGGLPPSNPSIPVSSVERSAASSSLIASVQPTSDSKSSRFDFLSSVQGSAPPSPSSPNSQPAFQTGQSSVGWTATLLPFPRSSGMPSSGVWSSPRSSFASWSGLTSAIPASSTAGSPSTTFKQSATTSGASSLPVQSSGISSSGTSSSGTFSSDASSSATTTFLPGPPVFGTSTTGLTFSPSSGPPSPWPITASGSETPRSSTGSTGTSFGSSSSLPGSSSASATSSGIQSSSIVGASSAQPQSSLSSTTNIPVPIPIIPGLSSSPSVPNAQSSSQAGSSTPRDSSTLAGSTSAGSTTVSSQALSFVPPFLGSSVPQLPSNSGATTHSRVSETSSPTPTSVQGSNAPIAVSPLLSSVKPLPTAIGCPDQCRNLDWCNIFCVGWTFPRPDYVQPPYECSLPENAGWCQLWWWGAPLDKDHNGVNPYPHLDNDPECIPNDCVADCIKWRIVTFFIFKRPVCPCVPKKCQNNGSTVKPKPTSHPKNTRPECKLFGCGCGWMGLAFGPGCPGLEFHLNTPCGIFGCNPCMFFGCAGTQPEGVVGYDGYCPGGGCEPCPPELCSRPGCTLPGGCGPKPGPAPTKPPNRPDPEACDDNHRTLITERFVWCTEGFNVSALPSSLRGTSSTMVSSLCLPMIDATVTMCGGAIPGFDTTTTETNTNTLTSNGPACTRAPLSLDDDEGNNSPDDPLNTSRTFASNTTTMTSTKASFSSPLTTKTSSSSSSTTKTSSSSSSTIKTSSSSPSATKTSFASPSPSVGPMDRNGHWKVQIAQYLFGDYSEVGWKLYDPNGNAAGENNIHGTGMKEMKDYVQSVNRPFQHMMPFGVDMTVSDPHDVKKCRVNFEIKKGMPGCDIAGGVECRPYMTTETFTEDKPFTFSICPDACSKKGQKPALAPSDLWCQDLNDADWEAMANGWKRHFECGWKGF